MANMKAYLLIEVAPEKPRGVVASLEGLEGVETAEVITGPYDIMAVLRGENLPAVMQIVTDKVHTLEGIVRTVTCVAVPGHEG